MTDNSDQGAAEKNRLALIIIRKLSDLGFLSLYAGGCVRDMVRGIHPSDIDIATTASPEIVEAAFIKTVPIGRQFGVILVVIEGVPFEVATFRREGNYVDGRHPSWVEASTPEDDAHRRDFTINGLFYDPLQDKIIDYVDGKKDIEGRIIRCIGNPDERFAEDKLRMLRAPRFAAYLEFDIEADTWDAIRRKAHEINLVSRERIRDELTKILIRPNSGNAVQLLNDLDLLRHFLPAVSDGCQILEIPHSQELANSSLLGICSSIMNKMDSTDFHSKLALLALMSGFESYPLSIRDITEAAGRARSQSKAFLKSLTFANRDVERTLSILRILCDWEITQDEGVGPMKRMLGLPMFSRALSLFRLLLLELSFNEASIKPLAELFSSSLPEDLHPTPYISGQDLVRLGMSPGPHFKAILNTLYDLQLDKSLISKESAISWAQEHFPHFIK